MTFRKTVLALHKILGLATGTVVFIVAITGCCWVFKDEIQGLYDGYKKVEPQNARMIAPTKAHGIAKSVFPNNTVHGTLYKKADDAIEVIFYDADPEFYQSVFIHPYSGKVIQVDDHLSGFFAFVLKGHMRLWLPKEIGEQVVGASILLFIMIVASGFLLWLPKKRKNLGQRLKFKWKDSTRWKRKNFDLHTIIGFYVCSLALILAITGTVMSYNWMKYVVYRSAGGDKEVQFLIPENDGYGELANPDIPSMDRLLTKLQTELPNAESYELHYPPTETSSIYVEISNSEGLYYDVDYRFFDPNTLAEIETPSIYGKYEDARFADKLLRMNYDIHVGAIGGIAGKIIAFFASLLVATLPVTGVLLWYGRKYKRRKVSIA